MKQYFLVAYMQGNNRNNPNLAKAFGNTHMLSENLFVGERDETHPVMCETVRSELMEGNKDKMMVIKLDADFTSAWYLKQESSEYLKTIFNEIHNGEKK